jgi:hypothetical protein
VTIRRDALVEALDRATQSRVIVALLDSLGLEMMEIKPICESSRWHGLAIDGVRCDHA